MSKSMFSISTPLAACPDCGGVILDSRWSVLALTEMLKSVCVQFANEHWACRKSDEPVASR